MLREVIDHTLGVVLAKARIHYHRPSFGEDWWLTAQRRNFSLG